jgi:uncharacterized protein YjiS (DUF1127 family)
MSAQIQKRSKGRRRGIRLLVENGIMNLLMALADSLRLYRHYHAALRELRSYNRAELNELGLSPSDIARVAMEEAERRLEAERPAAHGDAPRGAALAGG